MCDQVRNIRNRNTTKSVDITGRGNGQGLAQENRTYQGRHIRDIDRTIEVDVTGPVGPSFNMVIFLGQ